MRKVFVVTSLLVLLDVGLQIYFAAVGVFNRPQTDHSYALHTLNWQVLMGLALFNTATAALSRTGARSVGLAALPLLLTPLQIGIFILTDAFVPTGTPKLADGTPAVLEGTPNYVVALHAVNALLILAFAVVTFRRAKRLAGAPPAPPPVRLADAVTAEQPAVP